MFEKEAEEYQIRKHHQRLYGHKPVVMKELNTTFKDGAEFGYNKANEWHNINDIEFSKEQLGKQLLIRLESVIGDTDYDYLVYKYSGESITDIPGVIAWKEIE